MNTAVFNWEKKKVSDIELDPSIFSKKMNPDIISEIVRWQRAKKRQGSHKAKTRAEVSGGGAKPFQQKGTGRARQGSIRSPLLRKGGRAHGPRPRNYAYRLAGKKVRKSGMKMLLSRLYSEKLLFIVEDMISKEGKTKELLERLKNFGLKKALLVDEKKDPLFSRACKNLKSYQLMAVSGLNVYDLLKYQNLILTKKAVEDIHKKFSSKKEAS